jgi:hypothetical protein
MKRWQRRCAHVRNRCGPVGRGARLGDQLLAGLVQTHERTIGIARLFDRFPARLAATKPGLASGGITHCRLRCGLIPRLADHDAQAHSRIPVDMIRQGGSTSLFHASQQRSTIWP